MFGSLAGFDHGYRVAYKIAAHFGRLRGRQAAKVLAARLEEQEAAWTQQLAEIETRVMSFVEREADSSCAQQVDVEVVEWIEKAGQLQALAALTDS